MQSSANNIRLINAFPTLEFDTNTTVGGGKTYFSYTPVLRNAPYPDPRSSASHLEIQYIPR